MITTKAVNGKTYKNDYRAILSWVIDRVKAENEKKKTKNAFEQRSYNNYDKLYANKQN